MQLPSAPEGGIYKSKKISVPPGAGKDACMLVPTTVNARSHICPILVPNITEPAKPTHEKSSYAPQDRSTAPAGRPAPGPPKAGGVKAPAPPGGPKKFGGPAKMAAAVAEDEPPVDEPPISPPGPRPMPGGPKKMGGPGPAPGGPKKMGPGPGGPGPAPGGPKKMGPGPGGPGPAPGGPKKMGPGPGGPGGPKKMAPPPAGGARPTPPGM